jgi:4-carboxymuconolactone decarboxylase
MSRIPYLHYEELGPDGRAVWQSVTGTRGSDVVSAEGGLVGPFNAWVHAPSIGGPAVELGAAIRFRSSLDPGLRELAILTVGARWHAEFEWWAHSRIALAQGVAPSVIDAIAADHEPEFTTDAERVVFTLVKGLVEDGKVQHQTMASAVAELGTAAAVELVTLCGYYTMVSFVLNAFEVPLPPDVRPRWS